LGGANSDISIDDLLKGIIVQSCGDACVVSPNPWRFGAVFSDLLNARARRLAHPVSFRQVQRILPVPANHVGGRVWARLPRMSSAPIPTLQYFALKDHCINIRQPNRNTLVNENLGVTV